MISATLAFQSLLTAIFRGNFSRSPLGDPLVLILFQNSESDVTTDFFETKQKIALWRHSTTSFYYGLLMNLDRTHTHAHALIPKIKPRKKREKSKQNRILHIDTP